MSNNKKENFKRIAESRTNKVIDLLSSFSNFLNTSFYEYEKEQIEAIFDEIQLELDKQRQKLLFKENFKKRRFEL